MANQPKREPLPATPEQVEAGGPTPADRPSAAQPGERTPGNLYGVSAPAVQAARGTSEEHQAVDGVTTTSLAPPGKPDGEVDTRPGH